MDSATHWAEVHGGADPTAKSWYQVVPLPSLDLIAKSGVGIDARIADIGCGASSLVDHLLKRGHRSIVLVDISPEALRNVQSRIGERPDVQIMVGDVLVDLEVGPVDLWHDRALFHFLTDADSRARYRQVLLQHVVPGGHVVISTFAADGPESCSGLPTARYSPEALAAEFAPHFTFEADLRDVHVTPDGREQPFTFVLLRRGPQLPNL